MAALNAGDVLSYSSGSTQGGPWGFRRLRPQRDLLGACGRRWPVLLEALHGRTPIIINAYPAHLGRFDFGIFVDSYMSPRTVSRSLQLAALEKHPVVLMGQPLFLGEVVWRHVQAGHDLPESLIWASAGYSLPLSLQAMAEEACASRGCRLFVVQFYGTAEVDAGCLIAMDRNASGELVYHPSGPEVQVDLERSEVFLSLRSPDGELLVERFATGDCARPVDDGYVIWNEDRANPVILDELESWSAEDWRRRTGYLRCGMDLCLQLREGVSPACESELDFWEFGGRFGFSWLEKPDWS